MTLDDLVRIAWDAYDNQHTEWDAMRSAVLAVLDEVERECVPAPMPMPMEWISIGWNDCRAEVLRRIQTMRE